METPILDIYYKLLNYGISYPAIFKGAMPRSGLCNNLRLYNNLNGAYADFNELFHPRCKVDICGGYWGHSKAFDKPICGLPNNQYIRIKYEFDELRQTLLLLYAAERGEL